MAVNLFDMSPAEQLRALEARKIDLGFVGLRPPMGEKDTSSLAWECIAHHDVVVVLPSRHPLAKKSKIKIADLKSLFFVAMSEETHPGSRNWLSVLCQQAGFTPRILQDVALESGIMTFVAEGLGVTLARERIKNLPHEGVVFSSLGGSHESRLLDRMASGEPFQGSSQIHRHRQGRGAVLALEFVVHSHQL